MCRFYYFLKKNFKYEQNVCDSCYHYIIYERDNCDLIFRIVTVKKGTFRTVSSYFFVEIEEILENEDINLKKKIGWLHKENLKQRINKNEEEVSAD